MISENLKCWKFHKLIALLLSVLLFALSLFTIIYTVQPENVSFRGYEAFLLGWMDLSGAGIAWFANPLSVIAILLFLFNQLKASYVIGFVALAFGLGFIVYESFFTNAIHDHIKIGLSYVFWIASIFNICFAALYLINWRKKRSLNR